MAGKKDNKLGRIFFIVISVLVLVSMLSGFLMMLFNAV